MGKYILSILRNTAVKSRVRAGAVVEGQGASLGLFEFGIGGHRTIDSSVHFS